MKNNKGFIVSLIMVVMIIVVIFAAIALGIRAANRESKRVYTVNQLNTNGDVLNSWKTTNIGSMRGGIGFYTASDKYIFVSPPYTLTED